MYDIAHTALDTVVRMKPMVRSIGLLGMRVNLSPTLKRAIVDKSTENQMDYAGLLIFIAIGAVVGWLAGILMKGGEGNIIIGIVGAVAGGVLFGLLGLIGSIFTAIVGAAILLFLVWFIMKSKHQS
jgi:uncharacterized membrane protein YeaQ/YmgE (transglycosylase-associated protein family)